MAKAKKKPAAKAKPARPAGVRVGDRVTVTRPGCYVGARVSTVRAIRGAVADIQLDGKHVTAEFPLRELAIL